MEYTRSSVNLRAYGQRDPLIEYKKEGLRLFRDMEVVFKEQVYSLVKTIHLTDNNVAPEVQENKQIILSSDENSGPVQASAGDKIGRNDPCPCGSGKKYKKCHGLNQS
jgi:preprotein translocase subunit SecA